MRDDAVPQRETSPLLMRRLHELGLNRKLLLAATAALSLAVCGIVCFGSQAQPTVLIGQAISTASTLSNTATHVIAKARAQKLWSWAMQ
jgi:hypothetical protein